MESIWQAQIRDTMERIDFPKDSIREIMEASYKLLENSKAYADFRALLVPYEESEYCDYGKLLEGAMAVTQEAEIPEATGAMILLLSMCDKLKQRYALRGLSEEIYYNTIADLKYKNEECLLLYGISGTFVAGWFPGFFALMRFGLGRLQFEITKLGRDCTCGDLSLSKDDDVINIHIPRTGTRLDHDEVLRSYHLAKEFFKDSFKGRPTVFTCHSWLLYPWHETVLSKSSNLYAFYKDFEIIAWGDHDQSHPDAWRLFDCVFTGDASKLPRDSSLRRAYADRIASGQPTGWGHGVFLLE